MEAQPPRQPTPPPLSSPPPPPPSHHPSYPDSLDSSPRSRTTDPWDEPYPPHSTNKLRLMVSYGGHITPRPHDKVLCYVGGDTRIVVVDRHISLFDLSTRLSKPFLNGLPFVLKYQLPNEDLDSLISVTTDEDLENMIEEFDQRCSNSCSSSKPSRIRLFLFPAKPDSSGPVSVLDGPGSGLGSGKSEDWLSGSGLLDGGLSESASVNCLIGLDDDAAVGVAAAAAGSNNDADVAAQGGNGKNLKQGQDVQSVPESPMLETNSSFGSTLSAPNLPRIKVHVEDGGSTGGGVRGLDQKVVGIEEQFAQLGVGGTAAGEGQKHDEETAALTSPPAVVPEPVSSVAAVSGEYPNHPNRVVSDDERSDHGVPMGYRKPPTPQSQPQTQTQILVQSQAQAQAQGLPQFQQQSTGVVDLPSPKSVSSDSSLTNAMLHPKPINVIYQDQIQIQSGASRVPVTSVDPNLSVSDPHSLVRMQQHLPDPGYVLPHQFDQQKQQQALQHQFSQLQQQLALQHQFEQQQHKHQALQHQFDQEQQLHQLQKQASQNQFDQQQQQQQSQQQAVQHLLDQQQQQQRQQALQHQLDQQNQAQQPQQYFIHHTPAGPVSIPAYYPIYPSQQQLHPQNHYQIDQQYPVYYVPARQPQAYNLSVQQANLGESAPTIPSSQPQNLPNPAAMLSPSSAYNPMRNAPLTNSEMTTASTYRMAAAGTPQLVQVPTGQHQQQQYVAYSQIHHPAQSVAPNPATPANYAYNYVDPAHAQIFYSQNPAPTLPSQSRP